MPYNTRRKSLSLSSLGIHVPVTHAARAAAAAAVAAAAAASGASTPSSSNGDSPRSYPRRSVENDVTRHSPSSGQHQSKRIKRVHNSTAVDFSAPDRDSSKTSRFDPTSRKFEHTPPPSPGASSDTDSNADDDEISSRRAAKRLRLEEINDDIVEGVISQLVATGNRPHLVKELAAVLSQKLSSVIQCVYSCNSRTTRSARSAEQCLHKTRSKQLTYDDSSANPCAIITSRLSAFMKRPCWSASTPCPVAKELEHVHPRRIYYFLTTCPRQPLPLAPSSCNDQSLRMRVSPSISGDIDLSAFVDDISRRQLSPSPEVDLSSPELDDMDCEVDSPSTSMSPVRSTPDFQQERRSRGGSPPLEKDEKEFTQTANGLQRKKIGPYLSPAETLDPGSGLDESLFCDTGAVSYSMASSAMVVSPAIKPTPAGGVVRKDVEGEGLFRPYGLLDWDEMPENMELEELDCLFESC